MGSDQCNLDGHSIDSNKVQHLALNTFGKLLAFVIPVTTGGVLPEHPLVTSARANHPGADVTERQARGVDDKLATKKELPQCKL